MYAYGLTSGEIAIVEGIGGTGIAWRERPTVTQEIAELT
jgi:hypothetical protein